MSTTKLIEVWNKVDQLDAEGREELTLIQPKDRPIAISALTGEGVDDAARGDRGAARAGRSLLDIHLEAADGQGLHWLYEHTEVMARENAEDGGVNLTVRVAPETLPRVRRRFPSLA